MPENSHHPYLPQPTDARAVSTTLDAPLPPNGLSARALQRTCAYIEAHLCESFSLADLAREACISRFHFARLFRASTGSSPMEYVLKARMEAAKQMLARGDQKIAVTAAALGFFDQSHFTRTFRRITGVSPRAFSRMHPTAMVRTMTVGSGIGPDLLTLRRPYWTGPPEALAGSSTAPWRRGPTAGGESHPALKTLRCVCR